MLRIQGIQRVEETGREMVRLATAFAEDMASYASWSLVAVFDMLRRIPYREDHPDAETVQRPAYTLAGLGPGGDCDDKMICLASWATLNRIPWEFLAVGNGGTVYHVVLGLLLPGGWMQVDPTYKRNELGVVRAYDTVIPIGGHP